MSLWNVFNLQNPWPIHQVKAHPNKEFEMYMYDVFEFEMYEGTVKDNPMLR